MERKKINNLKTLLEISSSGDDKINFFQELIDFMIVDCHPWLLTHFRIIDTQGFKGEYVYNILKLKLGCTPLMKWK